MPERPSARPCESNCNFLSLSLSQRADAEHNDRDRLHETTSFKEIDKSESPSLSARAVGALYDRSYPSSLSLPLLRSRLRSNRFFIIIQKLFLLHSPNNQSYRWKNWLNSLWGEAHLHLATNGDKKKFGEIYTIWVFGSKVRKTKKKKASSILILAHS